MSRTIEKYNIDKYRALDLTDMTEINHQKRYEQLVALTIGYRQAGYSDDEIRAMLMEPSISARYEEVSALFDAADNTELSELDY